MANLLLIEPKSSGHQPVYAAHLARAAAGAGHTVTLSTLDSSAAHPVYAAVGKTAGVRMVLLNTALPRKGDGVFSLMRAEFAYHDLLRRMYRQAAAEAQPDAVLVCYLDSCVNAIAIKGSPFGRTPWSGIVMRQRFHHAASGVPTAAAPLDAIKKKMFLRMLRNNSLAKLFTIDPTLPRWCEQVVGPLAVRTSYLPDPADLSPADSMISAARGRFGIPEGVCLVLLYGSIGPRKGIAPLLEAAVRLGNFHVLLAGAQTDAAKQVLQMSSAVELRRQGRLHEADHFLDEQEQGAAFAAADIVWLGYQGHDTMSGVIVLAGAAGRPVLSCDRGLIGWMTQNYQCGLAVDVADARVVATALGQLVASPSLRQQLGANGKEHFAVHTVENFTAPVLSWLMASD
ncbi:MAG: glycosyltransferase family 4 protein [Gammaproteobacteria bacterium]|nr:glycosyltransferase family 4 protein [Gammaproteobacteria bacterium]